MRYEKCQAEVVSFENASFMATSKGGKSFTSPSGNQYICVDIVWNHQTSNFGGISYPWINCYEVYRADGSAAGSGGYGCADYR